MMLLYNGASYSPFYNVGNGTSPECLFSSWMVAHYIIELLSGVVNFGICCNIGGLFVNIHYVHDCVMTDPSWHGFQHLDIFESRVRKLT